MVFLRAGLWATEMRVLLSKRPTQAPFYFYPPTELFPLSNAQPHPESADNLTLSSFAVYSIYLDTWLNSTVQVSRKYLSFSANP